MASGKCLGFSLVLIQSLILLCASASVHGHSIDNVERESDGSYRSRDHDHYTDDTHNADFDHEAILGSVREAEEFDKLSPDQARERLALLLPKMDVNGDKMVNRGELKKWIMNSFVKLAIEEAEERLAETDADNDGFVTWDEYLQDTFGVNSEDEVGADETGDTGLLLKDEKEMWQEADLNNDGKLDKTEYAMFSSPEDHEVMHKYLTKQTLREKDKNGDGLIDFEEYVGNRGDQHDKTWYISEKDKFDHELDLNKDGVLDNNEIHQWIIPDNNEIAEEEVEHLFDAADDDQSGDLSFAEILEHVDTFVGSEAAPFDPLGDRLDDEL